MDQRFAKVVEQLHPAFQRLILMKPLKNGMLPRGMPDKGIYLFSEGERHLYVGRSNRLRSRYGQHSNPGSPHNQAAFAFKLARGQTGKTAASYLPGEASRTGLLHDPEFFAAFMQAKARVRQMDYRYVEEVDQTRQALLELYAAIVLECPYNDFNTH